MRSLIRPASSTRALPTHAAVQRHAPSSTAACYRLQQSRVHGCVQSSALPLSIVVCTPTATAGSALATAGEDGQVRVWSRTGMLRSTLAQADAPVHCVAWGQDGDSLAYCSGPSVAVKPLQGGGAPGPGGSGAGGSSTGLAPGGGGGGSGAPRAGPGVAWRAHDGVVLALDWSPVSGLIVTAGEDCKYKVRRVLECRSCRLPCACGSTSCCPGPPGVVGLKATAGCWPKPLQQLK